MTDDQLRAVAEEIREWRRTGAFVTAARFDRLCGAVEELIRREVVRVPSAEGYVPPALGRSAWWGAVDAR